MSTRVRIEAVLPRDDGLEPHYARSDYCGTFGQRVATRLARSTDTPADVRFDWAVGSSPLDRALRERQHLPKSQRRLPAAAVETLLAAPPSVEDSFDPTAVLRDITWLVHVSRQRDLEEVVAEWAGLGIADTVAHRYDREACAALLERDLEPFADVARHAEQIHGRIVVWVHL
jgi:hypothetical protein